MSTTHCGHLWAYNPAWLTPAEGSSEEEFFLSLYYHSGVLGAVRVHEQEQRRPIVAVEAILRH
jgi:hypothetical protein